MDRACVDALDKKLWPEMQELGAAWRVMSHYATRCVCIFLPMPLLGLHDMPAKFWSEALYLLAPGRQESCQNWKLRCNMCVKTCAHCLSI